MCKNQTIFETKMAEINTLFPSKMVTKPVPFGTQTSINNPGKGVIPP